MRASVRARVILADEKGVQPGNVLSSLGQALLATAP